LISVSLRLLRLAADPPLSKAAERIALTEQVLAACKPGRMGWLLGGAVELAPGLRLQVFEVAARVLQTHWQALWLHLLWLHLLWLHLLWLHLLWLHLLWLHLLWLHLLRLLWQVLREREEELSHLLHLLARGLAQPSDLEPFLKCLGAFRSLWSLALRPQLNRADAPPWLKARTCMSHVYAQVGAICDGCVPYPLHRRAAMSHVSYRRALPSGCTHSPSFASTRHTRPCMLSYHTCCTPRLSAMWHRLTLRSGPTRSYSNPPFQPQPQP
jgi:hypothetical protein